MSLKRPSVTAKLPNSTDCWAMLERNSRFCSDWPNSAGRPVLHRINR